MFLFPCRPDKISNIFETTPALFWFKSDHHANKMISREKITSTKKRSVTSNSFSMLWHKNHGQRWETSSNSLSQWRRVVRFTHQKINFFFHHQQLSSVNKYIQLSNMKEKRINGKIIKQKIYKTQLRIFFLGS